MNPASISNFSIQNLKNLSDRDLIEKTRSLIRFEREVTVAVLHHLREIERRKVYCAMGISNLHDYCMNHLGYSSGAAQRRIDAMKLLKELPEMEDKILEGKLSFSTIVQVQSFVRKENKITDEPISKDEKKEILETLEGKSRRQVERELMKRSVQPEAHFQEKARAVSQTHTELKLILTEDAIQNLETLKGYLAHSHPSMSLSELVTYLAKFGVEKLNPAREPKNKKVTHSETKARENDQLSSAQDDSFEVMMPPVEFSGGKFRGSTAAVLNAPKIRHDDEFSEHLTSNLRKRYIPASLRRQIFQRDQGKCQKCGSKYALQLDHIHPFAQNGANTTENIRLLCRNCNRRYAIEKFGIRKIEQFS